MSRAEPILLENALERLLWFRASDEPAETFLDAVERDFGEEIAHELRRSLREASA